MFVSPHYRKVAAAGPSYPTPLQEWDFTQTAGNVTPAVVGDTDLPWVVGGLPLIVSGAGTQVQDGEAYVNAASDTLGNIFGINFRDDAWTVVWSFTTFDVNNWIGARNQEITRFSRGSMAVIWATSAINNDIDYQHGNLTRLERFGFNSLPGWTGDIEGLMMLAGAGNQPDEARGLASSPQGTLTLDETDLTTKNKNYSNGQIAYLRLGNDDAADGFPFTVKRGALWNSLITNQDAQNFIDAWKT